MSQVFKEGDRLVLELAERGPEGNGFNLQLLSPLLLGLLMPFMAVSYFAPEAFQHVRLAIWLFLVVMFILCTGLFFYTHHFPGEIDAIVVDRDARALRLEWRNRLATASQIIPFSDITALKLRNDYDDDGYPQPIAELVLRSRPPISLPNTVTEQQLRPIRAAIGLG